MLIFLKKKGKNRSVPSLEPLTSGCYLAHPFSFSRRVGPKDLNSWYSQFSCLIFIIKRMVWSSGIATQWGIGGLGADPPAAESKGV